MPTIAAPARPPSVEDRLAVVATAAALLSRADISSSSSRSTITPRRTGITAAMRRSGRHAPYIVSDPNASGPSAIAHSPSSPVRTRASRITARMSVCRSSKPGRGCRFRLDPILTSDAYPEIDSRAARYRSTRLSGTSHMMATLVKTSMANQGLTKASAMPERYRTGEILPLRSRPRA